ncbi:MAG TPA: hypothetical protein VN771_02505 [Candidatus Baltobacteraceae bacterium]|nr:hypothetical protein [Candidatus Baltobacteraceae bacterium]
MAVLAEGLWPAAEDVEVLAADLAGMGHHDESRTSEYEALTAFAQRLAARYADDACNQRRFLVHAGIAADMGGLT